MKTKEIYSDTTLCTINSQPVPKKNKKKKSTHAHIINLPQDLLLETCTPIPSPSLRTPLFLSGWGPGQLTKVTWVLSLTPDGCFKIHVSLFSDQGLTHTQTKMLKVPLQRKRVQSPVPHLPHLKPLPPRRENTPLFCFWFSTWEPTARSSTR